MVKEVAVVKDLRRGPVYFRLKKYAIKARDSAKKHGLKVRLTKVASGWKLAKVT